MRNVSILLLSLVLHLAVANQVEAGPADTSTVLVQVGYLENGSFIKLEEGSGFIVHPSGWVVTAKHVLDVQLPSGKVRHVRGAVRSKTAAMYELFQAPTPTVSADIVLLRFSPMLRSDWPFLKIKANHTIATSDVITAYGFPFNHEQERRPGSVSNLLGPNGSIGVNVGLAPGMSGGPVVLGDGRCVIGVVVGGSNYPNFDYFTPVQYAKSLLEIPPAEFVTDVATATQPGSAAQAPLFDRAYRIDETYDDHKADKSSKPYVFTFAADPGATIVSARFAEESAAAAYDKVLNIEADRAKATFKFRLESGPFYDRWRGWWHGQVVLTQQRAPQPAQQMVNCD